MRNVVEDLEVLDSALVELDRAEHTLVKALQASLENEECHMRGLMIQAMHEEGSSCEYAPKPTTKLACLTCKHRREHGEV